MESEECRKKKTDRQTDRQTDRRRRGRQREHGTRSDPIPRPLSLSLFALSSPSGSPSSSSKRVRLRPALPPLLCALRDGGWTDGRMRDTDLTLAECVCERERIEQNMESSSAPGSGRPNCACSPGLFGTPSSSFSFSVTSFLSFLLSFPSLFCPSSLLAVLQP